jgi:hypothetical protein
MLAASGFADDGGKIRLQEFGFGPPLLAAGS